MTQESEWDLLAAEFDSGLIKWSVYVISPEDAAPMLAIDPERILRTASVAKILLLIEAARAIEAGELRLDESLDRRSSERVADSGVWHHLSVELLTVDDVVRLIGLVSDNWATNVLLERVGGVESVERTARLLGIEGVALNDRVRNMRTPDTPPTLSEGSAQALALLMRRLLRGEDLPEGVGRRVLDWLTGGFDLSMVAAPIGLDPLAHSEPDRSIVLVNKTGTDAGVRADVGYLSGPSRSLIYACVANWDVSDNGLDEVRDEVLGAMHRLGIVLRSNVLSKTED